MNAKDYHKINHERFHMDIDRGVKDKREARAYIRSKARQADKDLVRAELEDYRASGADDGR